MAVMIPPTVHTGTRSEGERDVFSRFQKEAGTNGWTVLHSLDLPQHLTRQMGEIDFVVLVQELGVLCLSVKHHREVTRDGKGVWKLGQEVPSSEGPFKKARDDMFSLKERLSQDRPSLRGVPFGYAVLFTRAKPKVPIEPTEWRECEQIYSDEYHRRTLAAIVEDSLDGTRGHLGVGQLRRPTLEDIHSMVEYLRPEVEIFIPPKERAEITRQELKQYTDEQILALDDAQLNDRMLYMGPAGTGKTLLAIETYRREISAGRSSLFLCYNRFLREFAESELTGCGERPQTIDGFLLGVAELAAPPNASDQFWKSELPDRALAKILDDGSQPHWDSIVIDEAQDVLHRLYLDPLDQVLKGGLRNGRWMMFGDFERQAIYSAPEDWRGFVISNGASVRGLRINCRNPEMIAKYAEILGGLDPGYRAVRRTAEAGSAGPPLFYSTAEEQRKLLKAALERLRQRFEWKDIVVLSSKRDELSCARSLTEPEWKDRLTPFALNARGLRYSTIHRFKGLEAHAIVLTDIENIGAEERSSLFYTGTTRAVDSLVILAHEGVKGDILRALLQ